MATITIPPLPINTSSILSLVIAFIIGLIIGMIIKRLISVGLLILALVIILMAIGALSPSTVAHWLQSAGQYVNTAVATADELKIYIPYDSITFIIGLVIGLLK